MKKTFLASVLALSLFGSSCLGPDNLYNSVKNWNAGISDKDWLTEIVFVGLMVIPVYPIALFGDVVVFNTIDYWTGNETIKNPGAFTGFKKGD